VQLPHVCVHAKRPHDVRSRDAAFVKAYGNRWYMITADTVDGARRSGHDRRAQGERRRGGRHRNHTLWNDRLHHASPRRRHPSPAPSSWNLYGWDPWSKCTEGITKLDLAKEKIGVGRHDRREQIGPTTYDTRTTLASGASSGIRRSTRKARSGSSRALIDKYNHTPTSRCYLGYAAMMQILEAVSRAGTTDTAAVIKALEGHEFDGLKAGSVLLPAPGTTARAGRARRAGL